MNSWHREAVSAERSLQQQMTLGLQKTAGSWLRVQQAVQAKYIIHAVGPIWKDGFHKEETLLHDAYINALKAAKEKGCQSIAFPLISSGIYGYPREDAMRVAMGAINEYLKDYLMDVFLVLK